MRIGKASWEKLRILRKYEHSGWNANVTASERYWLRKRELDDCILEKLVEKILILAVWKKTWALKGRVCVVRKRYKHECFFYECAWGKR